jgi:cysteine synthase A
MIDAWFDLLLDQEVDLTPIRQQVASIRFLTVPTGGRLGGVSGVERARSITGILDVVVHASIGATVGPAEDAYGRVGWVMASGVRRDAVRRSVEQAAAAVRLDVDPALLPEPPRATASASL